MEKGKLVSRERKNIRHKEMTYRTPGRERTASISDTLVPVSVRPAVLIS